MLALHADNSSWSALWSVIQQDSEFGREVLESIAFQAATQDQIEQQLKEEYLADLYIFLTQHYPETEEHEQEAKELSGIEAQILGEIDGVRMWKNYIPQRLQERGTPEACDALQKIICELPELKSKLQWRLLEAENSARCKTWKSPQPEDILQIVLSQRDDESTSLHVGVLNMMSGDRIHYDLRGAKFGGGFAATGGTQIGGTFIDDSSPDTTAKTIETNKSTVKTILLLASNPKTTSSLRLNEEVREIDAALQRAQGRSQFDLKQKWAVRIQDVYQALLDFKPQFVHFSGHSTPDNGLILEDETGNVQLVNTQALVELLKLFAPHIECVVLNACYSEVQASAIATYIPYVIGMKKEIGDKAAIKFATGFYNALSAGESIEFAYKLGCSVIQLEGIPEHLTPDLKKKHK